LQKIENTPSKEHFPSTFKGLLKTFEVVMRWHANSSRDICYGRYTKLLR